MTSKTETAPLPMLEKRRIEAAMIKNVFDVLVERHGREEAEAVISQAVIKSSIEQGREFREQHGGEPGLEDFAALSDLWEMGGALKKKWLVKNADRLEYDMVHCGYADMYREMGLADIGHLLSCNRDGTFCLGYNPDMELTRTQTIMEGASYCDFRYRMKKKGEQDTDGG
ncbi:MAG TPA: 2-amino-thiazoline-4-carboxylic acid hydrolase, partial [Rhizobiales bacterium]|nr:2-amino-thiazoline-4-carboxylic acid hydrolase [Hyphomicrobiales bacterium]